MNYEIVVSATGYCEALNEYYPVSYTKKLVQEDLKDAIPYLYEQEFGTPYRELGWWLIPGAKEFVKDLEDKWSKNELDISYLYKNKDFLATLVPPYSQEELEEFKDDVEDSILSDLQALDDDELYELKEQDEDGVSYVIYDANENEIENGFVYFED